MDEHDYRAGAERGEYEWGAVGVVGLGSGADGYVWGYGKSCMGGGSCDNFRRGEGGCGRGYWGESRELRVGRGVLDE